LGISDLGVDVNQQPSRSMKKIIQLLFFTFCVLSVTGFLFLKPVQAAGGSLYLAPAVGTYLINDKFTITVKTFTGGNVINAGEGMLYFDTSLLEVVGVSKAGSIFSMWTTEPNFSNTKGTISFGGGIPPPGFSDQTGRVLAITFKAKAVGVAQVRFSSGAILANDGKGSNVLESMGGASFTVSAKESEQKVEEEKITTKLSATDNKKTISKTTTAKSTTTKVVFIPEYNKPAITSLTHPDQNAWSSNNTVEFSWAIPDGVTGMSYDFNHDLSFVPKPVSSELIGFKRYPGVEDGIWFMHVRFYDGKKWGTTEHYRVMIDTLRPQSFIIQVEQPDPNNWPTITFKTKDGLSGVRSYEVFVNSLEQSQYTLPEDEATDKLKVQLSQLGYGAHTALVRVVDQAGNETTATVKFTVQPIGAPTIKNYSKELKSTDQFFVNGTAPEGTFVNVYIQNEDGKIMTKMVPTDKAGNWFYLHGENLKNGRYFVWAEAENKYQLKSAPTAKASFLVSPPVFAVIGDFVVNYFTVFASLIFMILLIVIMIWYLTRMFKQKLKKETIEVEDVLHDNMKNLKNIVEAEIGKLHGIKRAKEIIKESDVMKRNLEETIHTTERKILKEIKDVERMLK